MASTTTADTHPGGTGLPTRSPVVGWLAVVSVMLGIFSIVTTEPPPATTTTDAPPTTTTTAPSTTIVTVAPTSTSIPG